MEIALASARPVTTQRRLNLFERYLTVWVGLCMLVGVALGKWMPDAVQALRDLELGHGSQVNLPIAVLIWLMIIPMMMKVDFASLRHVGKRPKGLFVTLLVNWLVKPFSMALIAWLFFRHLFAPWITPGEADQYIAGTIILAAAPCTAMVFVWSYLTRGDAAYTLVQVALNDIIMLFAFAPLVVFLLGISNIQVPWDTVMLSVLLYIVIPLTAGYFTRRLIIKCRSQDWLENVFLKRLEPVTQMGLIVTLVLLFSFQGDVILDNPLHILLIAIPLTIQTVFIFFIAYGWAKVWKVPHNIAAPAGLIGASNFFELAVAVAIGLFGLHSGAALVTVVGVLVEVPLMLALVRIANNTRSHFSIANSSV